MLFGLPEALIHSSLGFSALCPVFQTLPTTLLADLTGRGEKPAPLLDSPHSP
jgi:hypothetical protein